MSLSAARKNIVLILVAVLFTLAVGEVGARMLLPPPYRIISRKPSSMKAMPRFIPDAELGWVNAPEDATYHFVSTGRRGTSDAVYHMHGGFRDTSATPQTGPIVIAAGCSFTYGMGVNDEDTWPWLVQAQMPGYHLINAATSAYGVAQALMRADWVIAQDPGKVKAVLFAFGDFQVDRDRGGQRDLLSLYPFGRPHFVESGGGLKRVANVRFWTPGPLVERSVLAMSIINHVAEVANKTPNMDEASEICARLIEDFARRCQARNIAFGVVVLPHGSDTGPISTRIRNFMVPRLRKAQVQVFVPEFPRSSDGAIDRTKYFIASDEFHPNRDFNLIFSQSARKSFEALLAPANSK